MNPGGLTVGRIAGIEVRLAPSALVIVLLVGGGLAVGLLPQWHPDWGFLKTWTVALLAAALLLGSILAHELAHAVVAQAYGLRVRSITLFLFGGLADLEEEPDRPSVELLIAVAGPAASVFIGLMALTSGAFLVPPGTAELEPEALLASLGPGATVLLWLGPVNLILAAFNMLPGLPLDGGRVLRAVIWWATGSQRRATKQATASGRALGWAFVFVGIAMTFGLWIPGLGGGLVGGVWLVMIGFFLAWSAQQVWLQAQIADLLRGRSVGSLMVEAPMTLEAGIPTSHAMRALAEPGAPRSALVLDDGRLVGLVSVADLAALAGQPRGYVEEVMTPVERLFVVRPDQPALDALRELSVYHVHQLPVVADGHLVGLFRLGDVQRLAALAGGSPPPGEPS